MPWDGAAPWTKMFRDVPRVGHLKGLDNILKQPLLLARLCPTGSCCGTAVTSCTPGFGAIGHQRYQYFQCYFQCTRIPTGSQEDSWAGGIRCFVKWQTAGGAPQQRRAASRGPCAGRWHPACGELAGCPLCPSPRGMREDGSCPRLCRMVVSNHGGRLM